LRAVLPPFSVRTIKRENWAESWKRHFKPMEIGSSLLIKPSWSRRKARPGQRVVVLDPGLSFGTGQHPTTRFCLEQIAASRDPRREQSFLDVGTGSGILAIAAARLGYAPVHAFDFDPAAVRIARANAARNRAAKKLRISRKDLTQESKRRAYDLICANLLADLLISECRRLGSWLKPGGKLVVAGILKLQFGDVKSAFHSAGMRLVARRAEAEWESAVFSAPQKLFTKNISCF
jgi:ribosomal protein L11 methyltransferase